MDVEPRVTQRERKLHIESVHTITIALPHPRPRLRPRLRPDEAHRCANTADQL